ncbi:MAG: hypothetical protein GY830_04145 [Bacteroidetes bacterium]|nr:hypothetical protein [Bacteroidota bacterium]
MRNKTLINIAKVGFIISSIPILNESCIRTKKELKSYTEYIRINNEYIKKKEKKMDLIPYNFLNKMRNMLYSSKLSKI